MSVTRHRLAESLGQSIVVDNRAGGSTIIGTDLTAKAPPDGHTLLIVISTFAINPSLHPKPIIEQLSTELRKVLELPEVRSRLAADGSEAVGSRPEAFAAVIRADMARYATIVRQAGIRAD